MPTGKVETETETKFEVDETATVPDLGDLPGVARIDRPATYRLEAAYFDTPELALARSGISLRRRTGGVDEGWHLKLPTQGVRLELHVALGRSARTVPISLRRIVLGVTRNGPLQPVAIVSTERTVQVLLSEDGTSLAEFCDDRVVATRYGSGGEETQRWREWELEERATGDEDGRKLVRKAHSRLRKAGARRSAFASKVGRVLDVDARTAPIPTLGSASSEHELLGGHLREVVEDVHRLDPLVRADADDAVHQLRVRVRRLRSTLRAFQRSFDVALTDPVRADLAWLGEMLGRPRDIEVLRDHLDSLLSDEPRELVRGGVRAWISSQLRVEHREAHRAAVEAMASERYLTLVDRLDIWVEQPPWAEPRDRAAGKRLPKALARARADLGRAVAAASKSGHDDVSDLHAARRHAKRARYTAEVLAPVLGADAAKTARIAEKVQILLGSHHDSVVAAEKVLQMADAAKREGRDAFSLGLLRARLEDEAADNERAFWSQWGKLEKRL